MALTTVIVVSIFGFVIYRKKKKEKENVSTWKQNSEGEIKNDLE